MGVVCLIALKGAHEGENCDETGDTAVVANVAMEALIRWDDKLFQFGLRYLASLILLQLVLWRNLPIEDARVKDLKDDVHKDKDSQQDNCCVKQEHHVKE